MKLHAKHPPALLFAGLLLLGVNCGGHSEFADVLRAADADAGASEDETSCGNGVVDDGESCDTDDLAGETCATATLNARPIGDLACSSLCMFDTSGCTEGAGGAGGGDPFGGGGTSGDPIGGGGTTGGGGTSGDPTGGGLFGGGGTTGGGLFGGGGTTGGGTTGGGLFGGTGGGTGGGLFGGTGGGLFGGGTGGGGSAGSPGAGGSTGGSSSGGTGG